MTSAFLFLVPLAPYAAFRLTDFQPAPAAAAAAQGAIDSPLHPPGAPDRPDAGGPPSPLSDRAIRAVSRGWEWKPLESPGWKLLMADHFVLRGDVPLDDLRAAGACLEEFFRTLQARVGGDASGLMFSVRVFADLRDFRLYATLAGAPNAESFYDPRSAEVVVCLDRVRGRDALQRTLAHEFTHEYMDRVWHCTAPLWFAEGMAEYFSNFQVRDNAVQPGAIDRPALLRLRLDEPVPLKKFLKLDRSDFYGPEFPLLYAQAWSFVHYLFAQKKGVVDLLLRGEPLEDVEELEKGWTGYLKALE
jgi:hypothetical protein